MDCPLKFQVFWRGPVSPLSCTLMNFNTRFLFLAKVELENQALWHVLLHTLYQKCMLRLLVRDKLDKLIKI